MNRLLFVLCLCPGCMPSSPAKPESTLPPAALEYQENEEIELWLQEIEDWNKKTGQEKKEWLARFPNYLPPSERKFYKQTKTERTKEEVKAKEDKDNILRTGMK